MKQYIEITNSEKELIKEEYLHNVSVENLIVQFDICRDLIYQILFETHTIDVKGKYKPNYKNRSHEWKQAVADYYMTHSRFQTKDFFRTSDKCVDRVIEEFNLPRRTHSEELQFFKIQQYGSIEEYNKHMIEKSKETSIERYGVDNFAKSDEFRKKSVLTSQSRYGVDNPMQCDDVKQKVSKSCLERFGVAWYCMREEAKLGGIGSDSGPNLAFYNELKNVLDEDMIQREFCIEKFNYDFKVGNNLIEINPSSTHNSTWGVYKSSPKEKTYHSDKTKLAEKYGYRCIHVWDWDKFSNIIKLLIDRPRIYARNCVVKEIDKISAKEFIDNNHLQGYVKDAIRIGLYYNDELVSLMTFDKPRYNKNYQYELIRYCSTYNIVGGSEKLFKHFLTNYNPESIISYCDLSKFSGSTYEKLGFTLLGSSISKHWVSMKDGRHITDNLLRQHGFDQLFGTTYGKGTSNEQLMLNNNFVVVYDAGQATYIWKSS